ncbi:unnamed protein product [Durusdinium trenchii]|uniref:Uncharacterized protein n=2 Tax=Durusdinium trenchii TaxID=1381693 RepID=A0ABP0P046_9DINO
MWRLLCLVVVTPLAASTKLDELLLEVARKKSAEYNCSFSIAVRTPSGKAAVASGVVDFENAQPAKESDLYPWGSVTKMFTAASVMKLVGSGKFRLDDAIAPLVDDLLGKMAAKDPSQNFSSVEELWGADLAKTTLRQLLSMQSSIPDFDTATPSKGGGISKDPLRAELYTTPNHFYKPTELMSVPWVANHSKDCQAQPFVGKFCYSSTNFMLLGMALAQATGVDSWAAFNQTAFLPDYLQNQIRFANSGSPKDAGSVPGYDRTSYNRAPGNLSNHNNWEVEGVFAGWTASNVVATAAHIADLSWEIWKEHSLAPEALVKQMIPSAMHIYGMGAFNVGLFSGGVRGPLGQGYGHLGATYGYQSIVGFFPALNVSVAIATNIETDKQVQTPDSLCFTYHAVAGLLMNKTFDCKFQTMGYYGGRCTCSETPAPSGSASHAAIV